VAWVVLARLFGQELAPTRQWVVVATACVVISAGLALVFPTIAWYRGFSGVLHALFFAGATAWLLQTIARGALQSPRPLWLPAALVCGGWIKVFLEQPLAGATPYAEWLGAMTVPQAHLLGAACGAILGVLFGRAGVSARRAGAPEQRE